MPDALRASRIREEMTISLIGPLPRSHSPARVVKSLNFMLSVVSCQWSVVSCVLQRTTDNGRLTNSPLSHFDLVPDLRRLFVVFGFHRALKFLAKLGDVDRSFHRHAAAAATRRHLAQVMRRALVGPLN